MKTLEQARAQMPGVGILASLWHESAGGHHTLTTSALDGKRWGEQPALRGTVVSFYRGRGMGVPTNTFIFLLNLP